MEDVGEEKRMAGPVSAGGETGWNTGTDAGFPRIGMVEGKWERMRCGRSLALSDGRIGEGGVEARALVRSFVYEEEAVEVGAEEAAPPAPPFLGLGDLAFFGDLVAAFFGDLAFFGLAAFLGLLVVVEAGLAPAPRVEEVDLGLLGLAAFLGLAEEEEEEAFLVIAFLVLVAFFGLDATEVLAALRTGLLDAVLLRFVEVFFSADPEDEAVEEDAEEGEEEEEEAFLVDLALGLDEEEEEEDLFFLSLRSGLSL